jgi:dihydroxy-acid dehydratase
MASAAEIMGMALPGSSSNPAATKEKFDECDSVGEYMLNLLKNDIKPRDIMTRASFENAMVRPSSPSFPLTSSTERPCFTHRSSP